MDVSQLPESQRLALGTYTSVTNQPVEAAVPLLRRSEWNVQIAIAKYFDGEAPDPVEEARAALPPPSQSTHQEVLVNGIRTPRSRISTHQDIAPRVVPQPESQVNHHIPFPVAVLIAPCSLLFRLVSRLLRLFCRLFLFRSRIVPRSPNSKSFGITTISPDGRTLNPREPAAQFARELGSALEPPTLPLFQGSYAQAYDTAKRDSKFLIVVILSPEHDDNQRFIHQNLLVAETREFMAARSENFILWGASVRDGEAYRVSVALNCSKLPCTIIIAQDSSSPTMIVISRLSGTMSRPSYASSIQRVLDQHMPSLVRIRNNQTARLATANLREEQNSAYERSLAADREKARLRREAEAAEEDALQETLRKEREVFERQENLKRWKKWRSRTIAPEPKQGEAGISRMSIRMTDGKRVVRRFQSDLPMEELYAFVECFHELQQNQAGNIADEKVQSLGHEYGFRLVSSMPRNVYEVSNNETIGDVVGKSGNLIVEPLQED